MDSEEKKYIQFFLPESILMFGNNHLTSSQTYNYKVKLTPPGVKQRSKQTNKMLCWGRLKYQPTYHQYPPHHHHHHLFGGGSQTHGLIQAKNLRYHCLILKHRPWETMLQAPHHCALLHPTFKDAVSGSASLCTDCFILPLRILYSS